ncbi:hypothetical protein Ae168Ps1_5432 [Pseudonocardia sp. Ae168_Ps1]|nr:hypothetical protein Ae168Ps1_5432 [Pseudonocardia sp. Ae168_Ps1]
MLFRSPLNSRSFASVGRRVPQGNDAATGFVPGAVVTPVSLRLRFGGDRFASVPEGPVRYRRRGG